MSCRKGWIRSEDGDLDRDCQCSRDEVSRCRRSEHPLRVPGRGMKVEGEMAGEGPGPSRGFMGLSPFARYE